MSRHAFSDGSIEDQELYAMRAMERRSKISASEAVEKIIVHLEQQIEVLNMDLSRYAGDNIRIKLIKLRTEWIENLIIHLNHNI